MHGPNTKDSSEKQEKVSESYLHLMHTTLHFMSAVFHEGIFLTQLKLFDTSYLM